MISQALRSQRSRRDAARRAKYRQPLLDTGRLYTELLAAGFRARVAIRSITYVVDVLTRSRLT